MLKCIGDKQVNVKGVIFDMDGTILDSMDYWVKLCDKFQMEWNCKFDEEVKKMFLTGTCKEIAKIILKKTSISFNEKEIEEKLNEALENAYFREIPLKKDAYKLIHILKEQGIQVAIATATEKYLVEGMCKRTGIYDMVDVIITCAEAGSGKRKPAIYDRTVKKMNLTKDTVVIVEDALYAIKTAKSAGYYVIGIYEEVMKKDVEEIKKIANQFVYELKSIADDKWITDRKE